ncbi:tRNA (adenosine(37)-N6)-threonylcarbamoyltransferase complex dimerization subunit type 1 TsaB [Desulfomicrobium salsuginis]
MTSCATSASLFLALNCAEERLQVVLGTPGSLLFSEEILCPGQSIRHLPTAMERALAVRGATARDLAGIACVRGPGSFTGLRIAHAAMYGLSRAFAIPMAGLAYLELLVAQAADFATGETWVLTYARKGQVYMQGFLSGQPLGPVRPARVAQALGLLAGRPAPLFLLGSGLRTNPELQGLANASVLPPALDTPTPTALLAAACAASYAGSPPPPLYLRKSDAEDNLDAIAQSRGIPSDEARRHIPDFE